MVDPDMQFVPLGCLQLGKCDVCDRTRISYEYEERIMFNGGETSVQAALL